MCGIDAAMVSTRSGAFNAAAAARKGVADTKFLGYRRMVEQAQAEASGGPPASSNQKPTHLQASREGGGGKEGGSSGDGGRAFAARKGMEGSDPLPGRLLGPCRAG